MFPFSKLNRTLHLVKWEAVWLTEELMLSQYAYDSKRMRILHCLYGHVLEVVVGFDGLRNHLSPYYK